MWNNVIEDDDEDDDEDDHSDHHHHTVMSITKEQSIRRIEFDLKLTKRWKTYKVKVRSIFIRFHNTAWKYETEFLIWTNAKRGARTYERTKKNTNESKARQVIIDTQYHTAHHTFFYNAFQCLYNLLLFSLSKRAKKSKSINLLKICVCVHKSGTVT